MVSALFYALERRCDMRIYIVKRRLDDETLMSWLSRIAEANAISLDVLMKYYLNRRSKFHAIDFSLLSEVLDCGESAARLFVDTGTYCFEGLGDTREGQEKTLILSGITYNDNVETVRMVGNHYNRFCPECVKADIEKYGVAYMHRAHNLSDVTVCHKHACVLYETSAVMPNGKARAVKVKGDISIAEKYAKACSLIMDVRLDLDVSDIGKFIGSKIEEKKISHWLGKYNVSEYADFSGRLREGFYGLLKGDKTPMRVIVSVLLYMYEGNISRLVSDLEKLSACSRLGFVKRYIHRKGRKPGSSEESDSMMTLGIDKARKRAEAKGYDLLEYKNTVSIAKFRCRKCNNVFEQNYSWFCSYDSPCPYCNEQERKDFEGRVRNLFGNEYTVIGSYINNHTDIKIRHNVCGMEHEYNPMRFLDGRVSCRYCAEKLKESKTEGRIGETNIAKNGMRMTIIAYRNYKDVDVRFDDGTVREHIRYEHFLSGDVVNKNAGRADSAQVKAQVLGMQVKNIYNGKLMTLTEYRSARDVTVEVEDGTVFTTRLSRFRSGRLKYWLNKNKA